MQLASTAESAKWIVHGYFFCKQITKPTSLGSLVASLFGTFVGVQIGQKASFYLRKIHYKCNQEANKRLNPSIKRICHALIGVLFINRYSCLLEDLIWSSLAKITELSLIGRVCKATVLASASTINFINFSGYFEHTFGKEALMDLREQVTGCPFSLGDSRTENINCLAGLVIFTSLSAFVSRSSLSFSYLNIAHPLSESLWIITTGLSKKIKKTCIS